MLAFGVDSWWGSVWLGVSLYTAPVLLYLGLGTDRLGALLRPAVAVHAVLTVLLGRPYGCGSSNMNYFRVGNSYRVTRITGPTHNLLGLQFWGPAEPGGPVAVQALPVAADRAGRPQLSAEAIRECVLSGVADANARFATSYAVRCIEYVPTDSPQAEVYRWLAECVIERLASNQLFAEGSL